jgi:hypothetical protein
VVRSTLKPPPEVVQELAKAIQGLLAIYNKCSNDLQYWSFSNKHFEEFIKDFDDN